MQPERSVPSSVKGRVVVKSGRPFCFTRSSRYPLGSSAKNQTQLADAKNPAAGVLNSHAEINFFRKVVNQDRGGVGVVRS